MKDPMCTSLLTMLNFLSWALSPNCFSSLCFSSPWQWCLLPASALSEARGLKLSWKAQYQFALCQLWALVRLSTLKSISYDGNHVTVESVSIITIKWLPLGTATVMGTAGGPVLAPACQFPIQDHSGRCRSQCPRCWEKTPAHCVTAAQAVWWRRSVVFFVLCQQFIRSQDTFECFTPWGLWNVSNETLWWLRGQDL